MADSVILAKWFTALSGRQIDLFVWHRMQAPDKPGTAEGTGLFFQRLPASNKASAHHGFDSRDAVRYVRDQDVAYHAPGANSRGLGYELAGYSADDDWASKDSEAMLALAVAQAKIDTVLYSIPIQFRSWQDLRAGGDRARGHTTHWEVTQAFHKSDHTDPGPYFPMEHVLDMLRSSFSQTPQHQDVYIYNPTTEDDMAISPKAKVGQVSVAACKLGTEGFYVATADGGVRADQNASVPGPPAVFSYPGLPVDERKGTRRCTAIIPNEDGTPGYTLCFDDGNDFKFGPGYNSWPK